MKILLNCKGNIIAMRTKLEIENVYEIWWRKTKRKNLI